MRKTKAKTKSISKKPTAKKKVLAPKPKAPKPVVLNNRKIAAIKRAINGYISPKTHRSDFIVRYSNWYVGVTNNSKVRKVQHQRTKNLSAMYFKAWDAGTKEDALAIEKHFHVLGMLDKASTGGVRANSTFVYVFKANPNLMDNVFYILGAVE